MKRFNFPLPPHLEQIQMIADHNQLKTKLHQFWDQVAPYQSNLYRIIKRNKQAQISAQCKYCQSYLLYRQKPSSLLWKLAEVDNCHDHFGKCRKMRKNQRKKVQTFISLLIREYEREQLKQMTINRFSISTDIFNRQYNKQKRGFNLCFQQFVSRHQGQYDLVYQEQEFKEFPQTLLIINSTMKQLFNKYGDSIYFDCVPVSAYYIGFFFGKNNKMNDIVFAITVSCKFTATAIKIILADFLTATNKHPNSLFTTDHPIVSKGYLDLCKDQPIQFDHHFDPHTYLRHFETCPATYRKIKEALSARSESQFEQKFRDIETDGEVLNWINEDQFHKIWNNRQKICKFAYKKFCGVPEWDRSLQNLMHQLMDPFRHEDILMILQESLPVIQKINVFECVNRWNLITYRLPSCNKINLSEISQCMAEPIFLQFYQEFQHSLMCNFKDDCQLAHSQLTEFQVSESQSQQYIVVKQGDILSCECIIKQIMGVPCRHLILSACRLNIDLMNLFNPRWIIPSKNFEKRKPGKSTHTNRLW